MDGPAEGLVEPAPSTPFFISTAAARVYDMVLLQDQSTVLSFIFHSVCILVAAVVSLISVKPDPSVTAFPARTEP